MRKILFSLAFLGLALVFSLAAPSAKAQSEANVTFPIQELGNCESREDCRDYCNKEENREACLKYGEEKGLVKKGTAEKIKSLPKTGPGGCESPEDCRDYCEDPAHQEECINFAERNGFISKEEAQRARKFAGQTGPGGCKGEACKEYCNDPAHGKECFEFARQNGLISEEEAAAVEELMNQGGPGGCKSHEECEQYCAEENHLEECLAFGEQKGFISKEEAAKIRKLGFAGVGPGGCRGEACKEYCRDEAHLEECIKFGEEKGLITPEEAQMARKMAGQTGPGGCKGAACRTYCEDPAHMSECIDFAEKQGFMSGEEAARAKKFAQAAQAGGPGGCRGEECRDYCSNPEHSDECMKFAEDHGLLTPEDKMKIEAGKKLHQTVQELGGPGGCKSEEECKIYCSDSAHVEECVAFAVSHGGMPEEQAKKMLQEFQEQKAFMREGFNENRRNFDADSQRKFEEFRRLEDQFRSQGGAPEGNSFEGRRGSFPASNFNEGGRPGFEGEPRDGGLRNFSGPGGCKSPSECRKYCSENFEECSKFRPGSPDGSAMEASSPDLQIPADSANKNSVKPVQPRRPQPSFRPDFGNDPTRAPQSGAGFAGPGGCRSADECARYCLQNLAECQRFAPGPNHDPAPGLNMREPGNLPPADFKNFEMPPEAHRRGPGGCASEEECARFCENNPAECGRPAQSQEFQEQPN